jgi:predicted DNA-binding transcriptional regulator YafY
VRAAPRHRHFRADRIVELTVLADSFAGQGEELLRGWLAQRSREHAAQAVPITI